MNIGPKTVAVFHYTLRNEAGTELESSRGADPTAYLHGANNIIPGLESAMTGRAAGDVFSATVDPEQAYGLRNPEKTQRVPMKHLAFKGKLRPGMVVQLSTSEGKRAVTVTAEVDSEITNSERITTELGEKLADIGTMFPGVSVSNAS